MLWNIKVSRKIYLNKYLVACLNFNKPQHINYAKWQMLQLVLSSKSSSTHYLLPSPFMSKFRIPTSQLFAKLSLNAFHFDQNISNFQHSLQIWCGPGRERTWTRNYLANAIVLQNARNAFSKEEPQTAIWTRPCLPLILSSK